MILKERPAPLDSGEGTIYKRYPYQIVYGSGFHPYMSEAELRSIHKTYKAIGETYPNNVYIVGYAGVERFSATTRAPKFKAFNDVDHHRSVTVNKPFTLYYTDNNLKRSLQYYRVDMDYLPGTTLSSVTSFVDLPKPDVSDQLFSNRAWHHMRPRFEGAVSMLNFLMELKDFRDVSTALTGMFRKSGRLSNQSYLQRLLKTRQGQKRADSSLGDDGGMSAIYDPTRVAGGLMLFKHFAVDPLIRDVSDLMTQAGIMASKAYEQFVAKGLTDNSRHYTERSNTDGATYGEFYPGIRVYATSTRLIRTATMQYTYDYSPRDPRDVFKRFWGLDWNWDTYWNAIPFTFLFDYFVQFGKALSAVDHDKNLLLTVTQYCESRKLEARGGIFYTGRWRDQGGFFCDNKRIETDDRFLITGVSRSHYQRIRKQPTTDGLYVPIIKLPSTKQGLNILALARCFI